MDKSHKLTERFHSLRFRINFLVFFAVAMLMVFLVCNNAYAIAVVRENAFDATADMMEMYMNRVDESMEIMENYWAGIQASNDMFILLAPEEPMDYYTAQARLKIDMETIVQTYSYIDDIFIYFNEEGKYFDAGKYTLEGSERVAIKKMIIQWLSDTTDGKLAGQWQCMEYGGSHYLVRIFRYRNIYMGGCVNISRLISAMRSDGFGNIDYLTFYENHGGELGNVLPADGQDLTVDGTRQRFSMNMDGSRYLIITHPSGCGDYSLVAMIRDKSILEGLGALQKIILLLMVVLILFLIVFSALGRRWIIMPVKRLCHAMDCLKNGDFSVRLAAGESCTEFKLVNDTFDDMIENIQSLKIHVYEEKVQRQRAELGYQQAQLQYQKAELQYLKLQVNPHFYINCLNVIHNLSIMNKNDLVRDMATYLGNHLRYTMEGNTVDALEKEVDYVRNYLRIQRLRFADGLKAYIEIEAGVEKVLVPPLVIQTFVENTVKYQVVAGEHTEIYIVVSWCDSPEDHRIRMEIWDTGEGFSERVLTCLKNNEKIIDQKGEHFGIRNVMSRLRLIYGGRESMEFKNHWETGGAYIVMELPDDGGRSEVQENGGTDRS